MEREFFKSTLSKMIAEVKSESDHVLDLRVERAPYSQENKAIFSINELDLVFDYVKDSEEWFVDIYENVWFGKTGTAEFTGIALLSEDFRKLLSKRPLTAEEKFDARLKELGIYEDWCQQGCCGRVGVATSEGIKILVHEDEDDRFTEFTYPPMREMEKSDQFRIKALGEFYPAMSDDKEFMSNLVHWVANPANKNPLFPVDVYFLWSDYTWQDFVDDEEESKEVAEYKTCDVTEEYCEHCADHVILAGELKVQQCPQCGKWIVPCSLCPLTACTHKECPLSELAKIFNK